MNISLLGVEILIEGGPDHTVRVNCDTELLRSFSNVSVVSK